MKLTMRGRIHYAGADARAGGARKQHQQQASSSQAAGDPQQEDGSTGTGSAAAGPLEDIYRVWLDSCLARNK